MKFTSIAGYARSILFQGGACILMALLPAGCGDSTVNDDDSNKTTERTAGPELELVGNADVEVSESTNTAENISVHFATASLCHKNSGAGTFEAKFQSENQSLTIRVRNFTAGAKTYTCKQAANNQTSESSLGDRFHGCGVELSVDPDDALGFASYASYRNATTIAPFQYDGECQVQVSQAQIEFKATVSCSKMVQTFFDGSVRNPIDPAVVATTSATVSCEMVNQ
jgi:hypothetical protein